MNTAQNKTAEETVTRLMCKVNAIADWLAAVPLRLGSKANLNTWPLLPGSYKVGERSAPVAVCTLTSNGLYASLSSLPGVAIAGRVYSANLGLEKIITNITSNPAIRFLLVCGKESPYFQVGQALGALFSNGVTEGGRIIQATGHLPELTHIGRARIEHFRKQVRFVDCTGESDISKLAGVIQELVGQNQGPYQEIITADENIKIQAENSHKFKPIPLGGHRETLAYDPNGFFVITIDRTAGDILVHHYLPDNTPAHVVRGRHGESILLALLREKLISQKSHAGYLGAELAKAETALRLNLAYEQDRPLRLR
jgi:tetrahydromethanopterin S-methyltransferase subunit A